MARDGDTVLAPRFYAQLMMPSESAHDTIAALGEVGLLQFKDLNMDKSAFQRTFANQVRDAARYSHVRRLRYSKAVPHLLISYVCDR